MDNLDDIKQVWLSANVTDLPKATDILQTIKKYRFKATLKTAVALLLTMLLLVTMCLVMTGYHSQLLTTRIGETLMLIAILILLSVNIVSLKTISASKTFSNHEFVLFLKQEELRLMRYQKITQKIGFALASIGLGFYIFEEVHKQTAVLIWSYAGVIIWCCVCWFLLRPIAMKRKTKQLNKTIVTLEEFSKQLQNKST